MSKTSFQRRLRGPPSREPTSQWTQFSKVKSPRFQAVASPPDRVCISRISLSNPHFWR